MRSIMGDFAEKGIYGIPIATLDVETTGLGPEARVCQLAIVHSNLGQGNSEVVFNEYINPCMPIPEAASVVHGITDEKVASCPVFWDLFPRIQKALEGRIMAAYNLPFDLDQVNKEMRICPVDLDPYPWFGICGLVLSRFVDDMHRGKGAHKLESVAGRRQMTFKAHDAAEDAMITSKLLDLLFREAAQKRGRFGTVREYWAFQRVVAIQQEEDLRCYLRKKGVNRPSWPWTDR